MYKIALVCKWGCSTGMLAKKIEESGKEMGEDILVNAFPEDDISKIVNEYDVILLGPQLTYKLSPFKSEFPDRANRIMVVDTVAFGTMNGEKVLKDALAFTADL